MRDPAITWAFVGGHMIKTRTIAAWLAAMTIAATAAPAQTVTGSEPEMARAADQLVFPNSAPRIEQVFARNAAILTLPIVWRRGATLAQDVTITAGPDSRALPRGTALQGAELTDQAGVVRINAYCTARIAAERKADKGVMGALLGGGSLWRGLIKGATDRQFCLIDADRDGSAERSVMINAGTPAARTPMAIAPVALQPQAMLPISANDVVRIVLTDISRAGKAVAVRLDIVQQGETRMFTSAGPTTRVTRISTKTLPTSQVIYGARFDIIAVDGAGQTVTIRWPGAVDTATPVIVDDGLDVRVRY